MGPLKLYRVVHFSDNFVMKKTSTEIGRIFDINGVLSRSFNLYTALVVVPGHSLMRLWRDIIEPYFFSFPPTQVHIQGEVL